MTELRVGTRAGVDEILALPDFSRLKRRIIETTGLHYYEDRDRTVAEKIEQRCLLLGCSGGDYMIRALASGAGGEFGALIDDLTIGETYFFRYPEQFDRLRRDILPERIAYRRDDRSLRCWSAGCASGAEAYSLAILLEEHFRPTLADWQVTILGTDINHNALAQAREARFSDWELRSTDDDLRERYFVRTGHGWQLRERFRRHTDFAYQNLATDIETFAQANAGRFDLILCRNVMIYFTPDLMRRMIRHFAGCLAPGGWLLVGHAEPYFEIANVLAPEMAHGTTAYRKEGGPVAPVRHRERPEPVAEPLPVSPVQAESPLLGDMTAALVPLPCPVPALSAVPDSPLPRQDSSADAEMAGIRALASAGSWPAAAAAARRGIQRFPMDPAFHFTYALIAEHLGDTGETLAALGRALYLDRSLPLAHYHLGRIHARGGDLRAARKAFENVVRLLAGRADDWPLPMGDGLTAGELQGLVGFQLGQMTSGRHAGH